MAATRLSIRRRRPLLFLLVTGFIVGVAWITRDAWRSSRRGRLSRGGGAHPPADSAVEPPAVEPPAAVVPADVAPARLLHAVSGASGDDLTRLEGIGPRMAAALHAEGLSSYAILAEASPDEIRAALANQGLRFAPSLATWPTQASLLAAGDEIGFSALTATLRRGIPPAD